MRLSQSYVLPKRDHVTSILVSKTTDLLIIVLGSFRVEFRLRLGWDDSYKTFIVYTTMRVVPIHPR